MRKKETAIPGLWTIETDVHRDLRGSFSVSYNRGALSELGIDDQLEQTNYVSSHRGALRGLHFQTPPYAQSKLVRCVRGSVYDVAIDIRVGSPTYGKWFGIELTGVSGQMLYVPVGFAHGYYALSECDFEYHVGASVYQPQHEGGLRWNDPGIGIKWPIDGDIIMNDRDKQWPLLTELNSPFSYTL